MKSTKGPTQKMGPTSPSAHVKPHGTKAGSVGKPAAPSTLKRIGVTPPFAGGGKGVGKKGGY